MDIQLGKWLPDYGPRVDGLLVCRNVLPVNGKYIQAYDKSRYSGNAVTDPPLILFTVITSSLAVRSFVGTSSGLYRLDTDVAFDDISKVGGYTTIEPYTWDWTLYGESLIMTNFVNDIQILSDIVTSSNFVNLLSSTIYAKTMCMFKDHLFLGYTKEGSTVYERRIHRSAKGDIDDFVADDSTGAGYYDIPAWGEHLVVVRPMSNILLAYMSKSLWIVNFVGAPYWFSYDRVNECSGPVSAQAVAQIADDLHAYLALDDVYRVDTNGITSIGNGIRMAVNNSIDPENSFKTTHCVDRLRKLVIWSYVSIGSLDGNPDKQLIYNWEEDRFSIVDMVCTVTGNIIKYSASVIDNIATVIDASGEIIDSSALKGQLMLPAVVDTSGYLCTVDGLPLSSVIRVGEAIFDQVYDIMEVRPEIDNLLGTLTCEVFTKFSITDSYSSSEINTMSGGKVDLRRSGRIGMIELVITGGHNGISGFKLEMVPAGNR